MFTGIIEAIGSLQKVESYQDDLQLTIQSGTLDLSDVQLGDSIAHNGVCLTVVQLTEQGYMTDVSIETLNYSTFASLPVGSLLNLEKSLTLSTRLSGHLVSGHVDSIGTVVSIEFSNRSIVYWIEAQKNIARYIAHKGSIAIDGVSLTINELKNDCRFSLNVIPHTQQKTIIKNYQLGTAVNLEVDILARYLERLIDPFLKKNKYLLF